MITPKHNRKIQLAIGLLCGLASVSAQAALTSETVNGANLVYNSTTNTTWTADANLLGTMETKAVSLYGNDNQLITDIINANNGVVYDTPNFYDNGVRTLVAGDFLGTGGLVDWWGAKAFAIYLNSINYGGSSQWAMPSTPSSTSSVGNQLAELYTAELNLGANATGYVPNVLNFPTINVGPVTNIQTGSYWSGTEYANLPPLTPDWAWAFSTLSAQQFSQNKPTQFLFFAWAVSSGNAASPVPLPGAAWLFGAGIMGFLGLRRSSNIG
jgi:hypothetical protein